MSLNIGDEVHDVGIPFYSHQLIDLNAADPCNPSQVVSSQIDEHDMFRSLLWVLQEFVGEAPVFLFIFPPSSRSGNGPEFRGRPYKDEIVKLQVKKVWRRIDIAKSPVEIYGIHVISALKPLRENNLDYIA